MATTRMTSTTRAVAVRGAKGLAVAAVAAVLCLRLWSAAHGWSEDARTGPDANIGSGILSALVSQAAGVLSMPVLLWAGMRLAREKHNYLLVIGGALIWLFLGAHLVEDAVGTTATVLFLALFAVLGGAMSLVGARGAALGE